MLPLLCCLSRQGHDAIQNIFECLLVLVCRISSTFRTFHIFGAIPLHLERGEDNPGIETINVLVRITGKTSQRFHQIQEFIDVLTEILVSTQIRRKQDIS